MGTFTFMEIFKIKFNYNKQKSSNRISQMICKLAFIWKISFMEEEEFAILHSIKEEIKNPVYTGFFITIKNDSPKWGVIPFIKANCKSIEEQAAGRT